MNLIILDDEGRPLYGQQLLEHIAKTNTPNLCHTVEGIWTETYVLYVAEKFPGVPEVRALVQNLEEAEAQEGGEIDWHLLNAVDDSIELTIDDAEQMVALQTE